MGTGLVYVNYGREEDFEALAKLGVNVSGTIVIARYGKIFRGNKVRCAILTMGVTSMLRVVCHAN